MKKFLFLLAFMPFTGFAALSSLNQSIVEIQKILKSREINEYFDQNETIQEITRKNESTLIIRTEQKQMLVEVIYLPVQRIAPLNFKLIFHPATPIR